MTSSRIEVEQNEKRGGGYVRAVLYDVDWQVLRVSTLKGLQSGGGWNTPTGAKANLGVLTSYIYTLEEADADVRRYRVHNMLNAVVMGYHGQQELGADK